MEEESVLPIVGEDLLRVHCDGRESLLYPLLARRLAEALQLPSKDLPPSEELDEVARRHLATCSIAKPFGRYSWIRP